MSEYARGYQDALREIHAIAEVEGLEAVLAYVKANLRK